MKKILLSLAVLALAAACGQDTFTVKGTITDADQLPEGAVISLMNPAGEEITTAPITDGTFTLKGDASDEQMNIITVNWPDKNRRDRSWMVPFIPEKGKFDLDMSRNDFELEGGTANKAYKRFQEDVNGIAQDMQAKMMALADDATDEADKLYEEGMAKIKDLSLSAIAKNAKNYVALAALQNIIYDLDLEELDGILAKCGKFVGENDAIKSIRDSKEAEIKTAEGQPFVDFDGKTPEGAAIKLSDIVGKGKWVLADFWASWCGPCMGEIPNIKRTHETLSGDKFTVLGVAVWDADDNGGNSTSLAKMDEMGMTWPQIFVGDDKTPTDLYGIVGIPTMILFAPDGTICKRGGDLRGAQMMEKVRDIINQ